MDLKGIKPDFRKEIIRGGEAFLDGQVKIATSADSRASSLAGIFTAAATALMGGVVIGVSNPTWSAVPHSTAIVIGGFAAALCFLTGAVLCVTAIMPTSFWLPGCEPENWEDDIKAKRLLDDCLGERAKHIQEMIVENAGTIVRNSRYFKWGARAGIAAPFIGVAAWIVARCLV